MGLNQISDVSAIETVVVDILKQNPQQVEQFRAGKDKVFGFFVGQVMRQMKGRGNPELVNQILMKKLKEDLN
jgi:aspartyl-tRNA(Asn)/glutamyl-tRNA(Gln) amidotransferase subunit B